MYCASCGKQQPSTAIFCPYCGARHAEEVRESVCTQPASQPVSHSVPQPKPLHANVDFPDDDLNPIFLFEKTKWMFRYPDPHIAPPAWTGSTVDFMVSEAYVIFQYTEDVTTLSEAIMGAAYVAGMLVAGGIGAAVPVVGIAAGLSAIAADKMTTANAPAQERKFAGYGKKNQLTREAIFQSFIAGHTLWAKKADLEFRGLSAKASILKDTLHYLAIIGKFHHAQGVYDLAVVKELSTLYGADFKKDIAQQGECRILPDQRFRARSQVLRSLSQYPLPDVATHLDDFWI